MDPLIAFAIEIGIFAVAGWGLWWLCRKFEMPRWVYYLCGGFLIALVLLLLLHQARFPAPLR